MSDLGSGGFTPPPVSNAHAAGLADIARAAHDHRRLLKAENMAELKAMRGSRFAPLRRLFARFGRRTD